MAIRKGKRSQGQIVHSLAHTLQTLLFISMFMLSPGTPQLGNNLDYFHTSEKFHLGQCPNVLLIVYMNF